MQQQLSMIDLVWNASWVVQLVLLVLLLASITSWMMIFSRWKALKQAKQQANRFEKRFWSGVDVAVLFQEINQQAQPPTGMETIFVAGFREFSRVKEQTIDAIAMVDSCQRAMRVTLAREMDELEQHLSFLATIGSISPYIGLFGTVWGIMNSFIALGNVEQATLALVAPGIAEALIATAIGLFAAIPAVIAYNRFANDVERLGNRYDVFLEEFSTIFQRYADMIIKAKKHGI